MAPCHDDDAAIWSGHARELVDECSLVRHVLSRFHGPGEIKADGHFARESSRNRIEEREKLIEFYIMVCIRCFFCESLGFGEQKKRKSEDEEE